MLVVSEPAPSTNRVKERRSVASSVHQVAVQTLEVLNAQTNFNDTFVQRLRQLVAT